MRTPAQPHREQRSHAAAVDLTEQLEEDLRAGVGLPGSRNHIVRTACAHRAEMAVGHLARTGEDHAGRDGRPPSLYGPPGCWAPFRQKVVAVVRYLRESGIVRRRGGWNGARLRSFATHPHQKRHHRPPRRKTAWGALSTGDQVPRGQPTRRPDALRRAGDESLRCHGDVRSGRITTSSSMNRREFWRSYRPHPLSPARKDRAMIPIVDTHQHLWDLSRVKLAWFDSKSPEGKILGHDFTPKEYAEATKGLNIVKAVYMEVDVVPEQQQKEADYVIELCASGKTPTCAAVVSGRPKSEGFAKWAKQFKSHKYVRGIRQVLHVKDTPAGYCLDDKFVRGIQLLGELGLSFDLCVRPAELPDCVKLVDKCPDTRFILDHCGNANPSTRQPNGTVEGNDRDREAEERGVQGERLHRDGAGAREVDARRSRAGRQPHARRLRPRSRDVRRRLAGLLARR